MSEELLPGWTEVPLGGLLREPLAAGRTGPAVPGGIPVLRVTALWSATVDLSESRVGPWTSEAQAAHSLIEPDDILISRDGGPGAPVGRASLVRETVGPMSYPGSMVRVRVDKRLIDPEYLVLAWESRAVRRQIQSSVRRTTNLHHIATRDLERVRLPLPPRAEQERIKASLNFWLTRVDEEKATIRATLRQIEDLRTLVIDHEVVGHTVRGRHVDPEPSTAAAHHAPLATVPAGWQWTPIDELAEVVRGPSVDSRRTDEPQGVEVGSLRPAEFRGEQWAHERMPRVRVGADTAQRNRLSPGDILFVLSGQLDSLGLGRVWEQDSPHHTYVPSQHVARVRMTGDALHPRLLALYMNGPGRRQLRDFARSTTSGILSLGLEALRRTLVPVPPLSEQGALLASLEAWDQGLTTVMASAKEVLTMADQLRDDCREQAVAGKLPDRSPPSSGDDVRPEGAVTVPPMKPVQRPVDRPSEVEHRAEQLWSAYSLLSKDGLTTLEYVEQVTYLLFLKTAQELRRRPLNSIDVLGHDAWDELALSDGTELTQYYSALLSTMSERRGVVGRIFHKAHNPLRRPVHLQKLIQQVGRLAWWDIHPEWRAPVFDAFLARFSEDRRTAAGQYFTQRSLVDAIVACTHPTVEDTIVDPTAGTGGFLVRSIEHIARNLPPGVPTVQRERLSRGAIRGTELVDTAARLATMNLFLHGAERLDNDQAAIEVRDSLAESPGRRATLVLAHPPLGQRRWAVPSTDTPDLHSADDVAFARPDFWAATNNQQLNFLQHVYTLLEIGGRAAVVVPDSVLFAAGAGERVRRQLLKQCNVHTLLRLPFGFSRVASAVMLNVLFFEKAAARTDRLPATRQLWVYDLRTGSATATDVPDSPPADLNGFVAAYRPGFSPDTRTASPAFKPYPVDVLLARPDVNLDLYADLGETEPEDIPEPHLIAHQISAQLEDSWRRFARLADELTPPRDARTFRSD